MSEPLKTQDFERYAWVSYDSEENCRRAKDQLEGQKVPPAAGSSQKERSEHSEFRLQPVKSQTQRKPIRITPPLAEDSLKRDLAFCRKLIAQVFDPEKQLNSMDKLQEACDRLGSNTQQQLDLMLLYLRRVHAYCFYCGEEYDDERMLAAKCGPQHIRAAKRLSRQDIDGNGNYAGSKSFEEKYLQAANDRLARGERELVPPEQDKILLECKTRYAQKKTEEVTKG